MTFEKFLIFYLLSIFGIMFISISFDVFFETKLRKNKKFKIFFNFYTLSWLVVTVIFFSLDKINIF